MRALHALGLLASLCIVACGDDGGTAGAGATAGAPATGGGGAGGVGGAEGGGGAGVDPTQACVDLGLPSKAFVDDDAGTTRGAIGGDFEVPLLDGTTFSFRARYSGCETYVFLPDTLIENELTNDSIWERDLDDLIATSPRNVHYFFVSRRTDDAEAAASLSAMQGRVTEELAALAPADAAHWSTRLHLVRDRAALLEGWLPEVLDGVGRAGFAIDRDQRLRGVGFLADVNRYSNALAMQDKWPWSANMSYAAHEAHYMNAQEETDLRLAADGATVVNLWDGEILEQFEEIDLTLPSAAELAEFDTLEIEVESRCPLEDELEFGNCGAWDYLAIFSVYEGETRFEIARFITSYHRETRWVVDASSLLPLIAEGGTRRFRWDFAPEWNTQPTRTRFDLRFSNQGKATRPATTELLWTGGPFNSAYNATREPVTRTVPAGTTKTEVVSIITGHGAATNQCSEFCNHQHRLVANGEPFLREFPEAGTEEGCIAQVSGLMVPNQGGTWWFGRGGWCPGQQVTPWIVDLTSLAAPGEDLTISYEGLFGDATPPDDAGDILLSTYLVFHD
jgi:hypothetical protein